MGHSFTADTVFSFLHLFGEDGTYMSYHLTAES
jgi:hypothetical protein